jgi:hypothetical protein
MVIVFVAQQPVCSDLLLTCWFCMDGFLDVALGLEGWQA